MWCGGGIGMRTILKEKQIDFLMHFTRIENLRSILKSGLCPREDLDEDTCIFNDEYRYDRCENAVCTSIEFPNYKMFYTLRCKNPGTEWVVLAISAQVLLDFPCAFCETNAGSETMYNTPIQERMGKKAFLKLFKENSCGKCRKDLNIPDYYPTNPQAEVLVFSKIPVKYIKYAIFNSEDVLEKYRRYLPTNVEGFVDTDVFYGRRDYQKWQGTIN